MSETEGIPTDEQMVERVRPMVNDILENFNHQHITPAEAGMVILGLVNRLLQVLEPAPEARRHFVMTLINVVNSFQTEPLEAGEAH
jgi:hypothetical protein